MQAGFVRHVPNILSALRLAMAAAFPFVSVPARPFVILAAGLSDFADGWIARRYGVSSWIGGILDAVSDKAFVITVLVTLTVDGKMAAWQALVLVARDIGVGAVSAYTALRGEWSAFKNMPSRLFGKLTTAALFILFLLMSALPDHHTLHMVAGAASGGFSLAAAVDYVSRFVVAHRAWQLRGSSGVTASAD